MQYKILTNSPDSFELSARSSGVIKKLRELQLKSAYYDDRDRYGLAKELCDSSWIEKEEDGTNGTISFWMKPPEIGADAFRDQVAILLFPEAPVEDNMDHIDHEQAEKALQQFLGFIEPRHKKLDALSNFLTASRSAQISSTKPSMETVPGVSTTGTGETL